MTHETKQRYRRCGAGTLMARLCKLTPTCFTVIGRLLDLDQNDTGLFWITVEAVAWETGLKSNAVFDAFDRLEDEGLIRRIKRPYKGKRGKIKHTEFTSAFYQIIEWAEDAYEEVRKEVEEEAFRSGNEPPRKIRYDADRLATLLKSNGLWKKVIAKQTEHDPDTQEIPNITLRKFPTLHSGNSRLNAQETPDRTLGNSPTEKSNENSIDAKIKEVEGFSSKSPEERVIHRHGNSRNHAQPQSDPAAVEIWNKSLRELALQLPETTFETWVRDTQAERIENGELVISVPHAYALDWLQSRLANKVTRMLPGGLKPNFTIRGTQEQSQSPARDQPRPTADTPTEPSHDQGPGKLCACGETIPPDKADERDECKQCWEQKHRSTRESQPDRPIWTSEIPPRQPPDQKQEKLSSFEKARKEHIDFRQASIRNRKGPPAVPQ